MPERERTQERAQRRRRIRALKTRPIPPCRNSAMSSMLSAPATIPATSEDTFNPALRALVVGTLRCSSASSRSPARSANAITGTSPPTTPDSDHRTPPQQPRARMRQLHLEMPFVARNLGP